MQDFEICFAKQSQLKEIVKLNHFFVKENCCNGVVADDLEYFSTKQIVIAILNGKIVGYAYGCFEIETKNRAYASVGDKIFYLDEMYVLPKFRKLKLGKKLFNFLQEYARQNGCQLITLNAVSKNYKSLLKFYIENLNMEFWSAFLIKKL